MTTYAQLDKLAKQVGFVAEMAKRGFAHHRKFCFVRTREPFYDVVNGEIYSSGNDMRVWVDCWTPMNDNDLKKFPYGTGVMTGGKISPEALPDWWDWPIQNESKIKETLAILLTVIDRYALPWFDHIQTSEDYMALFDEPHAWKPSRKEKEAIHARLEQAFASKRETKQ